jgi:hypothetical protein
MTINGQKGLTETIYWEIVKPFPGLISMHPSSS